MANVFDVAEFFIRIANQSEDDQMTNMKLNKLLYYAQGAFLARTGTPLFENQIEAWPLGPVVTDIYHKYKVCGKNPISSDEDVNHAAFTEEEFETLLDVMREYGKYTGSTLVSLSHLPGTPWRNTQEKGEKVLDRDEIAAYFIAHPVPHLKEKITTPQVAALPADWYDPEEDAEWEAYL